jgi:hypothetical protein
MFTTMTITTTKSEVLNEKYEINLGVNLLDGVSQEQLDKWATKSAVIEVQNDKDNELRKCDDGEQIRQALVKRGFTDAIVDIWVKKDAPAKVSTPEDVMSLVDTGKMSLDALQKLIDERKAEEDNN